MGTLLGIAFVVGIVTSVSPCVLPVLPVVFAGGATGTTRRAVAIVVGLVAAFGLATLFGAVVLSAIGLPDDALMVAGEVVLVVLGVALLIEPVGALLERPFSRLAPGRVFGSSARSGTLLGLGLGLVFVPCAGPILATIVVASARHRVDASTVELTAAYAAGTAVPLLVLALASQRLAQHWSAIRRHARVLRRGAGAVVLAMGIAIWTGALTGLQTAAANGFATSVEQSLTKSCSVRSALLRLDGEHQLACSSAPTPTLADYGAAPAFSQVTAWLDTPGGRPLTWASLKGKVVLIDFWTYSCINCRRSIPHVEAWYRAYHRDGFVVVGVHTPEFDFEKVVANVRAAIGMLGVTYPVAVDDDYGTWNAWGNDSWPAEYLVDASGEIRYASIGEGDYSTTESAIRALLVAKGATDLPARTDVANTTPTCPQDRCPTPETYLGWQFQEEHQDANVVTPIQPDTTATYAVPSPLPANDLAYGGTWHVGAQYATAVRGASLELAFYAKDVYLVLAGHGTVRVLLGRHVVRVVHVSGIPDLYTMVALPSMQSGTLTMEVGAGVRCYDLTFG